jgi:hypothetical protein
MNYSKSTSFEASIYQKEDGGENFLDLHKDNMPDPHEDSDRLFRFLLAI